jgi:type II secretory ATPase GspE/PulE/Tfp pilus assembly ATPase PilB-like protein
MVDPEDLAALDYVGKMLAYSELKVEPFSLTFQQHQDLIAYYFSHPPDPAEVAALQAAHSHQSQKAPDSPSPPSAPESVEEPPAATAEVSPSRTTSRPIEGDSDETVQQLLNSMLRRALDEQADQIFVEPSEGHTCRIRYRQQGILRDLFKQLSDAIRSKLLISMKRMMALDEQVIGEPQTAEVERVYRGEPLVLQLRIVPQRSKEGAILSILRGDSLAKYQQNQNNVRIAETIQVAQQTQHTMQQLQTTLASMVEKLKQYPSQPTEEWQTLTITLEAIHAQARLIETYQQDWQSLSSPPS